MTLIYYFDFEASTNGDKHKPYCVCCSNADGSEIKSFYGEGCARQFLDYLPHHSLCYAHNLSYDINFILNILTAVFEGSIIKGSKVYMIKGMYNKKHLTFKDTYCMISSPLRLFPKMFHLDTGRKECYPYNYYTYPFRDVGVIEEALAFIPASDHQLFKDNVEAVAKRNLIDPTLFSMKDYAIFYCLQDVRILREGFEWFRQALLTEFNLDVYKFISISSIANRLMERECYWVNGNLYDLANTPRDFISRCVFGGRCMLSDNIKQSSSNEPIVDFDAVSLYPSAIARCYTLEGKPKVLQQHMLNQHYLQTHLFTDSQQHPTKNRFISGFFIEARIESISIHRHFPLIVYDPRWNRSTINHERAVNEPCVMYMDHIQFEDLIRYQGCVITPIRGYYYNSNRDHSCRDVIKNLFNLRLRYKKEGNPLQEIIKLLLNSIYGKTILKPINTSIKFVPMYKKERYIHNRYYYIKEMSGVDIGNKFMSIEYQPFSKHFTFCTLGVNILSMSKRIMNEVICTAEDLDIRVFFQDTDSIHIYRKDLDTLATEFKNRYHRELIGTNLGQFHSDFSPVNGDSNVFARRSIFVMKKTYIDELVNSKGEIAFHIRCKGIPHDVLVHTANELYPSSVSCSIKDGLVYPSSSSSSNDYSVMKLYEALYNEQTIEFDLASCKPCFDVHIGETRTKEHFIRRVGLKCTTEETHQQHHLSS